MAQNQNFLAAVKPCGITCPAAVDAEADELTVLVNAAYHDGSCLCRNQAQDNTS